MRYKSALAKADEICVRDAYSKQVVEKCYARTPLSYPDVVFLYGKEKKHTIKIVRERKCVAMFYRTIIASVYKGIHIKITKNGLPTY